MKFIVNEDFALGTQYEYEIKEHIDADNDKVEVWYSENDEDRCVLYKKIDVKRYLKDGIWIKQYDLTGQITI